jgi:hypothetical protein
MVFRDGPSADSVDGDIWVRLYYDMFCRFGPFDLDMDGRTGCSSGDGGLNGIVGRVFIDGEGK